MCTVTFIPVQTKVFITHNRDEQKGRLPATPPALYTFKDKTLLYPRDGKAGGSWIGMSNEGNSAMLLNGAFGKHHPSPSYIKSRGLVLLDILASNHMYEYFTSMNLTEVEPFTVILFNSIQLYECRWDGKVKHITELPASESHIWSSATLYDQEVSNRRTSWFREWVKENPLPSGEDILEFHQTAGDGDGENDLRMYRSNGMETLSLTSMMISPAHGRMTYIDFATNQSTGKKITFQKAPVRN